MTRWLLFFVYVMTPIFLFAQKKNKVHYRFTAGPEMKLDGILNEWKGHLYQEESALWSFGLVVKDYKLFAAIIVKDTSLIEEAIRNGILLNISYSDKKKRGAQFIFPRLNMEKLEHFKATNHDDAPFTKEDLIQSTKGYYVRGFDKVRDGLLSFDNAYGIHAVCTINKDGAMLYEAEIPLHLITFLTNDIAVQLAINSSATPYANRTVGKGYATTIARAGSNNPSTRIKGLAPENTMVWFTGLIK